MTELEAFRAEKDQFVTVQMVFAPNAPLKQRPDATSGGAALVLRGIEAFERVE